MKGKTMREFEQRETVIYGGAFNPPTRAHQAIVQACVEYAEPKNADVWLLPSASRTDKQIEVAFERRIELCEALLADVMTRTVEVHVEPMELNRGVQTETYDTVRELEQLYPDRHFTWVFGADSVATMHTWDHGKWLQEELSMLVINRPGVVMQQLGNHATHLAVDAGPFSSTALRQRIHDGDPFDDLVGESVYRLLAV